MITLSRCSPCGLALGAALATQPAWAGPAEDDPSTVQAAEAAYKQGKAFLDADRPDKALEKFEEANRLAPRSVLFFNIALAQRDLGRKQDALRSLEQYLEADPKGSRAEDATTLIVELTEEIEAEQAEAQRQREQAKREEAEQEQAVQEQAVAKVEQSRAEADRKRKRKRANALMGSGLGLSLVGLGGLGAGLAFGLRAQSIDDELSNHDDMWTDDLLAKPSDGRAAERNMIIFSAAGGAILATGAVLLGVGLHARKKTRPGVAITVGPSLTGLWARGSF